MATFQTFKDLNITFKPHPVTGDLIVKKDEAAVKQAVANVLMTNKAERPFRSNFVSSVRESLFEPLDAATAAKIGNAIENCLLTYEPRIKIRSLELEIDFDSNGYEVLLDFLIVGREDRPVLIEFFLERTR